MSYLLDTNAVIAILNDNLDFLQKVQRHHPKDLKISSIVMFELYFGAYKSQRMQQNLKKLQFLPFEILNFTAEDGLLAGRFRQELKLKGTPIGAYDVLIAGQAVNHNLTLITDNVDEFSRIAELTIENWLR
ncbi:MULTISPECIES: type II toxin-antitoxin system VapC family toxin [unclassified Moraxella]|uniref:type II toxin-antitoxin system VapC family toxin n=1 Tax=unclassified Moraxella TaxID=2685852 RepID=UPI003AF47D0E